MLPFRHGGAVPMHYSVLRTLLYFYNEDTFEVCLYFFPLSLLLSLSLRGLSPRLCGLMSMLP